ncbi:hypothetical protein P872_05985 [Rhodonellum psychrophilum GCM71 = DSM 17998]|uniref:Uncharacterized protein n=2 Tax=Rhodonellum TaxID=336827 RepID=U5C272_9BACT|nr:hypothetical protein P872_05985 [Rhodonellum psychrophilum GCM71 = DSM 17998]SDZ47722.1 hypothetical protein SAMN05444412_11671 [Rhodonellum ikkaensis]
MLDGNFYQFRQFNSFGKALMRDFGSFLKYKYYIELLNILIIDLIFYCFLKALGLYKVNR